MKTFHWSQRFRGQAKKFIYSFLIGKKKHNKTQKNQLGSSFACQKGTPDTYCQAAPVKQSVTPELSPTAVMYSPLNFISIQHFQDFSYVTWAHPDISSAITQYLNLGGILRRSPLDPDGDFCLFLGAKQSV